MTGGRAITRRKRVPAAKTTKKINARKRPRVVATKYGNLPNGKEALYLHNEGEVAHGVRAEDLKIGEWVVKFDDELPLLKTEDRLRVASILKITHLGNTEHLDTVDSLDYAWRDAQKPGVIERLPIRISYRDFEGNQFQTVCSLERDVLVRGDAPFRVTGCRDEPVDNVRLPERDGSVALKPTLVDKGPGNAEPALPGFKRTYIVGVQNGQMALKVTAHNVQAYLEYTHADGIDRFKTDPAGWITTRAEKRPSCSTTLDLGSGEMQKLILLGATESGEAQTITVEGNMGTRVGPGKVLKYGDWTVRGTVTADNCEPLDIAYAFHIGDGGLVQSFGRVARLAPYETRR